MDKTEPGSKIINWAIVMLTLLLAAKGAAVSWQMNAQQTCPCANVLTGKTTEKVDGALLQLLNTAQQNDCKIVAAKSQENGIVISAKGISVEIMVENEKAVTAVSALIKDMQGTVVSSFETTVYAILPAQALCRLITEKTVRHITPSRSMETYN